jgi:arsenite methyltransferase
MVDKNIGLESLKEYYGRTLRNSAGLKTNACCCNETIAPVHYEILEHIDSEIKDRFYGCGSPHSASAPRVYGS